MVRKGIPLLGLLWDDADGQRKGQGLLGERAVKGQGLGDGLSP